LSDRRDCGAVHLIGLKKVGSTQLARAFTNQKWEVQADVPRRYVTFVRHPAARLFSAWNYLVKKRIATINSASESVYGPAASWPEWIRWVLDSDLDALDHHLRPQWLELRDALKDSPEHSTLWIGSLDLSERVLPALEHYLARKMILERPNRSTIQWQPFYDRVLLEEVRRRFYGDVWLWMATHQVGYQFVSTADASNQLDEMTI
jgi:hypothetical protein